MKPGYKAMCDMILRILFVLCSSFNDVAAQQYAISAALIVSGICTLVNITRFRLPFTSKLFGRQLYLGTGVLSVMGTSFTFLPIFEICIRQMVADGEDGFTAYGRMLGTTMITALLELALSFLPRKWLKKLFPPLVCAITVMLIGLTLVGSGIKSWGGGVVCAEMIWKEHGMHASDSD
jgi:NCS2 family nucleobase:cation symporter-2